MHVIRTGKTWSKSEVEFREERVDFSWFNMSINDSNG